MLAFPVQRLQLGAQSAFADKGFVGFPVSIDFRTPKSPTSEMILSSRPLEKSYFKGDGNSKHSQMGVPSFQSICYWPKDSMMMSVIEIKAAQVTHPLGAQEGAFRQIHAFMQWIKMALPSSLGGSLRFI